MPFLGDMLNKMIGRETVGDIYNSRKETYKKVISLDKSLELLDEDKKSLDKLLKSGFLTEDDKKLIAKDFWENTHKIKAERNNLLNSIADHLEKTDPFGTKKK